MFYDLFFMEVGYPRSILDLVKSIGNVLLPFDFDSRS